MGPTIKQSIGCVSFLLFSHGFAWEWPFLSARRSTAAPTSNIIHGACSENGALVCNGPTLFGTCNYGSVVYQPVADGTVCKDGKIVHREASDPSCPVDGVLVCHGPRMYGFCNSGKVDYQPVIEGTWCQDGQIVGTGSPAQEKYHAAVPQLMVPRSAIPYSAVHYSAIPQSSIPQNRIPTSTITYSTIPQSFIPASHPTIVSEQGDGQLVANPASQPTIVSEKGDGQIIVNPVVHPPFVGKQGETQSKGGCPSAYPGGGPTATIDAGIVYGTTTSLPAATATVNKYLGIPFAASPPVRFSPPEKPQSWNAPINATAYKPACIQQFQCKYTHLS